MSPVLWCVGMSGIYVAVPTREVQHFATPAQAIQLLGNQQRYGTQTTNR